MLTMCVRLLDDYWYQGNHASCLERAWCNDDNTDAEGLQLAAHALRQRVQAGLAGRVGRLHACPDQGHAQLQQAMRSRGHQASPEW